MTGDQLRDLGEPQQGIKEGRIDHLGAQISTFQQTLEPLAVLNHGVALQQTHQTAR